LHALRRFLVARGKTLGVRDREIGILGKRGVTVTEAARKQLEACTDLAELERLFDRAFEVTRAEELFTN
jgi:hypothetical protein